MWHHLRALFEYLSGDLPRGPSWMTQHIWSGWRLLISPPYTDAICATCRSSPTDYKAEIAVQLIINGIEHQGRRKYDRGNKIYFVITAILKLLQPAAST